MTPPARKHSAPMVVPALAIAALTGSCVDGSINDVTAEAPKAIDPTRFRVTMRHDRDRARRQTQRWQTSA
jgi:hypothetical protein